MCTMFERVLCEGVVEELGVNHADIISDMITLWSGTSKTIWSPLPALGPWGALGFAGLVVSVYIRVSEEPRCSCKFWKGHGRMECFLFWWKQGK